MRTLADRSLRRSVPNVSETVGHCSYCAERGRPHRVKQAVVWLLERAHTFAEGAGAASLAAAYKLRDRFQGLRIGIVCSGGTGAARAIASIEHRAKRTRAGDAGQGSPGTPPGVPPAGGGPCTSETRREMRMAG